MSQQSGAMNAANAPTKQKFEELLNSLSEVEKNRFLAVYFSSTVSNTDWEATLKMTGSASKNSLTVMINKSLRRLRDAGLMDSGASQARVKRDRSGDLITPKTEKNDPSDDLPAQPPAKKRKLSRITSVDDAESSSKNTRAYHKPDLSDKSSP